MYQPAEDSLLLEKYSEKHSRGRVLDIGTGVGIQAIAASKNKKVDSVLAVDIDKEAVSYCKRNVENSKILFKHSDLFSEVDGKFDTIIFNPPYLPEEKDIRIKDKALFGGKKGHEVIEKFFKSAKTHLAENGVILFIFSSITGKDKVESIIKKAGLRHRQLEKKHFFFEDLYAYEVRK